VESADAILVLGEDLTASAPRLALALRQSVRNAAYTRAAELGLEPWQDAAVRNLAQDLRSPLYIAATGGTRLDDVAAGRISLAPAGIAAFGDAVADLLRGRSRAEAPALAQTVAGALRAAQRPLIIAGTSSGEAAVLDAAAAVAAALVDAGTQPMLSFVVPEANSLGLALLHGGDAPDLAALRARAEAGELDTLVVLENDLYARAPRSEIDALLSAVPQLIVLDALDTPTASRAGLVLASASHLECEGTLVSMEGRAQRHFPVMPPREERQPAWHWLLALLRARDGNRWTAVQHFDDLCRACAASRPALARMTEAAPGREYRTHGVRVPRQPHRYSGRTAMYADVSVHEPKPAADDDSPLVFSMEGLNRDEAGALLPFVWAPGWNSNHALHKFQAETGGALRGGQPGVRLVAPGAGAQAPAPAAPAGAPEPGSWQLVPQPVLFGSEALSAMSPGIRELVPEGFLSLAPADAASLGVTAGDGVRVGEGGPALQVRIDPAMPAGCAGYGLRLAGCGDLVPGAQVTLSRASDWRRRDDGVIARTGGEHG
jgi:NADH-quinone oxidoreductase subunit G